MSSTFEENKGSNIPVDSYQHYVDQGRLGQAFKADLEKHIQVQLGKTSQEKGTGRIYDVFHDQDHKNMQQYYRIQLEGNCFAHAPILLHLYLQMFYNKDLTIDEAKLIDLSKFIRNTFTGVDLQRYVVDGKGFPPATVADKIFKNFDTWTQDAPTSFHEYCELLKKYGPAIVSIGVGEDFQDNNKFIYEGKRPDYSHDKMQGHAMILSAVHECKVGGKTHIYFILQNFWPEKQFVKVREDCFLSSTIKWKDTKGGLQVDKPKMQI